MRNIRKILLLCLVVSLFASVCPVSAEAVREYFISPYGSRTADGSIADPFDTLHTALDVIVPDGKPIVINFRKGTYYMSTPAVFTPEFSGTSEAPVTIRAYQGERVVLSGGRPVVGWQELPNGLWRAYTPEYRFVRNMDMNGIGAVRAQSDTKIFHKGTFGTEYYPDGILVDSDALPKNFSGKNTEILIQHNWNEYHVKIDRCEKAGDTRKLYFKKPYSAMAFGSRPASVKNNTAFTVINDLSLLDKPGEFYFDADTGYLYYMPRSGEEARTSVGYIAKQEVLLKIQGENNRKKAGYLTFEGLTFANTTWKKAEYEGLISRQSVTYYDMANDLNTASPAYQTIPAAVQVDRAEHVVFRNNIFSNLGAVGLGFYDGVENTVTEGNIFRDIGSSAISVGLSAHHTPSAEGKTNVAFRKKAWASGTYTYYHALQALNGGLWTVGSGKNATWTVDLEKAYTISDIELLPRGDANYDKPSARMNFEILGSDDKDFSEYTVLASQGAEDFGIQNTWKAKINNQDKFRYIRYRKTDTASSEISDFRVYTEDLEGLPEKEVCKSNRISNNVIARAGRDFVGSAGIHAFYTEGLEVSNNLLTDLPYSGISLGWGWKAENTTSRDNVIRANRIEHSMQRQYDGGGIYILGDQPNLLVEDNVLRDIRYGAGGIYPDEGTSGTIAEAVVIRNNVVEDAAYWLHNWSNDSADMIISGNYATTPNYLNSGSRCTFGDNTLYLKNNPPVAVAAVIFASGPVGEYASLSEQVNGLPTATVETADDYRNYGPHTVTEIDTARYVKQYLSGLLMSAIWYEELLANHAADITESEEYALFSQAVAEARETHNVLLAGGGNCDTLFQARVSLKQSIDALLQSNICNGLEETTESITNSLLTRLKP